MIETHTVNALLHPSLKQAQAFTILTFVNGLVAPSFLFCAGFAFAITAHRRWQEYVSLKPTLWRYCARLLFILCIGYSLHVPVYSLRKILTLTDEGLWTSFFQADILQVIALTLMGGLLLVIIIRNEQRFILLSAFLAIIVIFIAPITWEMNFDHLPLWLRPYLSPNCKSQFPLIPWSAFLLSGLVIGYLFLKAREKGGERSLVQRLLVLSVGTIIVSLGIEFIPLTLYPNHDFWQASPEFFFVRLGLVVLCSIVLWRYEQRRMTAQSAETTPKRSVFALFGQESLLVYYVHLMIVYGETQSWSFIRLFGPTLYYVECFGLFIGLTLGMYVLAYAWRWMKGWNPKIARMVQWVTVASFVVAFVVR